MYNNNSVFVYSASVFGMARLTIEKPNLVKGIEKDHDEMVSVVVNLLGMGLLAFQVF